MIEIYINGKAYSIVDLIQAEGMNPPNVAPLGACRIYFDSVDNKLKASENGGEYLPILSPLERIAHGDLTDMPDTGGTNGDHDARYLMLDQTTPQTIINGVPIFNVGIQSNSFIKSVVNGDGFIYQRSVTSAVCPFRANDGRGNKTFSIEYGGSTAGWWQTRWYLHAYKLGLVTWNGGDILIDAVTNKGAFTAGNFEGYCNNYDLKLGDAAGATYVNIKDSGDNTVASINSDGAIFGAEIYNSAGAFKIQPDVTGDIVCFGDSDVGDTTDGMSLYIYRKAAEGDDYIRFYIDSSRLPRMGMTAAGVAYTAVRMNSGPVLDLAPFGINTKFFGSESAGNYYIRQYGYITAASGIKYIEWLVNDTDDYFHLATGDAYILGFKCDLAFLPRQVTDAGPMTATAGVTGEIVFNTSDTKFYGCTAGGSPATWAAFH